MKIKYLLYCFLLLLSSCKAIETIIEIPSTQTISVVGTGSKDAVVNPYAKGESFATITNIGENDFQIILKNRGIPIKRATIKPKETKDIELNAGFELYFESQQQSKAKISFRAKANYF